jgi:hypothetical protein
VWVVTRHQAHDQLVQENIKKKALHQFARQRGGRMPAGVGRGGGPWWKGLLGRGGRNMNRQGRPDFVARAYCRGEFNSVKLSEHLGKWVVLCLYPGDFTFV